MARLLSIASYAFVPDSYDGALLPDEMTPEGTLRRSWSMVRIGGPHPVHPHYPVTQVYIDNIASLPSRYPRTEECPSLVQIVYHFDPPQEI